MCLCANDSLTVFPITILDFFFLIQVDCRTSTSLWSLHSSLLVNACFLHDVSHFLETFHTPCSHSSSLCNQCDLNSYLVGRGLDVMSLLNSDSIKPSLELLRITEVYWRCDDDLPGEQLLFCTGHCLKTYLYSSFPEKSQTWQEDRLHTGGSYVCLLWVSSSVLYAAWQPAAQHRRILHILVLQKLQVNPKCNSQVAVNSSFEG